MNEPGSAGERVRHLTGEHSGAEDPPVVPTAREATTAPAIAPTFGQEEEFFLVDRDTRQARAGASEVLAVARPDDATLLDRACTICAEITRFQVEASTPVCRAAADLHGNLQGARTALAAAADTHGLAVAATGTAVLGDVACAPITDSARYRAIARGFGALRDAHAVCGQHVHVGIADPDTALGVLNHLRPWLPALLALTANSPFLRGRDTGHASWRSVTWSRLPSAGPPPLLASLDHHERAIGEMLASGAILDRRMVYWDVRLSPHLPTVEVRVGDVASTVEEAVLFAVLVRGLVVSALTRLAVGDPAPSPGDRVLRLAMWRAAHDGLEGRILDPSTGELVPARGGLDRLLEAAAPGLRVCGEADLAHRLLGRVLAVGSGAHRQRVAYERRGRFSDVVDLLVRQTHYGLVAVEA